MSVHNLAGPEPVLVGTLDLGFVQFDATVRELHTRTNDVSLYPLENGANVSDHVRPLPNALSITSIVSATPIIDPTKPTLPTRVADARALMIYFRDSGSAVDVYTMREHYTQMVVKSIGEPVDPNNANDFEGEIAFQQISTATAQFVQPPKPASPRATPRLDTGTKVPATTTDSSALNGVVNYSVAPVPTP